MSTQDTRVLSLLRKLCAIKSYHTDDGSVDEKDLAEFVAQFLGRFPWLTVQNVPLGNGMHYVVASDCAPEDVRVLIAGHIDTVPPSVGWTVPQDSVTEGKYYNLGAADTKAGIAAMLESIEVIGPTQGVAYLLYGDEEYYFNGIDRFLLDWPTLKPELALSLCGSYGEAMIACRGCMELEFTVAGVSGHAARQHKGASAIQALQHVLTGLAAMCVEHNKTATIKTSFNVGGFNGGSMVTKFEDGQKPLVQYTPNKVANSAWAVIDVRPGEPAITPGMLKEEAHRLLEQFNEGKENKVLFDRVENKVDRRPYCSTLEALEPLFEAFREVHKGKVSKAEDFGYLDVADLAADRGTALMCLSPAAGNNHNADEYVNLESLAAYHASCVAFLQKYKK